MKSNAILWYQCIVRFCFPFQRCLFCFHEIFADFYLFFKMVCEVECNSWIRSITTLFGFFDEFVGIIERNLTKVIKPRTFLKIWTFALLFVVHWLLKTNMFITNVFFWSSYFFSNIYFYQNFSLQKMTRSKKVYQLSCKKVIKSFVAQKCISYFASLEIFRASFMLKFLPFLRKCVKFKLECKFCFQQEFVG